MGGCDWLEFGRLRGSTLLTVPTGAGSFALTKLRCAAEKGGVQFGGNIRTMDGGGLPQSALLLIGSGAKVLRYEADLGLNEHESDLAYRHDPRLLVKLAEAHRMIGKAEDLLWPGKRPRAQVAILAPRSAELWDKTISPAPGYLAEEANVYRALQKANVPADFVEEDDLSPKGLGSYKVLYVTEPNIPAEFQKGLLAWIQGGGTLAISQGAGAADRYNDPCDILAKDPVNVGSGRVVRFNWTPGTFSEPISGKMISPVQAAKIVPPVTVDQPMIEALMLLSDSGAAVTLLTSSGKAQTEIRITVRIPFKAKSVESVKQGKLNFTQTEEGVQCSLPLDAADIVLLRP